MKVSVNILCLDTRKTLMMSLDIIRRELRFTSHEIIVIDNGSKDNLQCLEAPDLKVIRNEFNQGISIGKNQGIRASHGEFIFMIDGDVVPVPNSILMLIEYMETHPECDALGFLPNKFSMEQNRDMFSFNHERTCHTLFNPRVHCCACLFYGIYRKSIFDKVMMSEDGEFGKPGYGWEDHDFFETMKDAGIKQWACGMNTENGKYYHAINSSIKTMGYNFYQESSNRRGEQFKRKWEKVNA